MNSDTLTTIGTSEISAPDSRPNILDTLGLGFPGEVYVLSNEENGTHACRRLSETQMARETDVMGQGPLPHGLVCFRTAAQAVAAIKHYSEDRFTAKEVSFDDARDLAKKKGPPINCLLLIEHEDKLNVHYIN